MCVCVSPVGCVRVYTSITVGAAKTTANRCQEDARQQLVPRRRNVRIYVIILYTYINIKHRLVVPIRVLYYVMLHSGHQLTSDPKEEENTAAEGNTLLLLIYCVKVRASSVLRQCAMVVFHRQQRLLLFEWKPLRPRR